MLINLQRDKMQPKVRLINQINNMGTVSPSAVIPRNKFRKVFVQSNSCLGIKHARPAVTHKVGRYNIIFSVTQDTLELALGFLLIAASICSWVTFLESLTVRSTTETPTVGTQNDIPVNLSFSSGRTFPTALAVPMLLGMMLKEAALSPLQSLLDGPSTVF